MIENVRVNLDETDGAVPNVTFTKLISRENKWNEVETPEPALKRRKRKHSIGYDNKDIRVENLADELENLEPRDKLCKKRKKKRTEGHEGDVDRSNEETEHDAMFEQRNIVTYASVVQRAKHDQNNVKKHKRKHLTGTENGDDGDMKMETLASVPEITDCEEKTYKKRKSKEQFKQSNEETGGELTSEEQNTETRARVVHDPEDDRHVGTKKHKSKNKNNINGFCGDADGSPEKPTIGSGFYESLSITGDLIVRSDDEVLCQNVKKKKHKKTDVLLDGNSELHVETGSGNAQNEVHVEEAFDEKIIHEDESVRFDAKDESNNSVQSNKNSASPGDSTQLPSQNGDSEMPECNIMLNVTYIDVKSKFKERNRARGEKTCPLPNAKEVEYQMVGDTATSLEKHVKLENGTKLSFKDVKFGTLPPWLKKGNKPRCSYKHLIRGDITVAFKNTNLHQIAGYTRKM